LTSQNSEKQKITFHPIHHASFVILAENLKIIVDPVGDIEKYASYQNPDLILITHEHADHFNEVLINHLKGDRTTLIGSAVVVGKLGFGKALNNNENTTYNKIQIEAIPAYNTTPERQKYHKPGVGNGYVLSVFNKKIYVSGDTEDIPEVRALKNIDYAFICINLPYTMSVEQAASAVLDINPRNVYPYHYRNQGGTYSDIHGEFKTLISENKSIKIHYLKWYDEE
jgi:L-ascorbate metabolism protein UlaG (beta-lactamase superfamily)